MMSKSSNPWSLSALSSSPDESLVRSTEQDVVRGKLSGRTRTTFDEAMMLAEKARETGSKMQLGSSENYFLARVKH